MKRLGTLTLLVIVALAAFLLAWPVPIDPVVWTPAPDPGLTGPYAQSTTFRGLTTLITDAGLGPEDVTRGADGFFYTGLQDGRILRFSAEGGAGGFALAFDRSGEFIGRRFRVE